MGFIFVGCIRGAIVVEYIRKAVNDNQLANYFWCDCGRANYWIELNEASGLYHIICSNCKTDHTMTVIG